MGLVLYVSHSYTNAILPLSNLTLLSGHLFTCGYLQNPVKLFVYAVPFAQRALSYTCVRTMIGLLSMTSIKFAIMRTGNRGIL